MFSGDEAKYFQAGLSALSNIRLALQQAKKTECHSILDLPCGHGRVLRYLRAEFPEAQITACELNRDGVDFCQATWNAKGVYSQPHFNWQLGDQYDLIWCGSLFTHLDRKQWESLLHFFLRHLQPEGVLVFSAHGRWVAKRLSTRQKTYGLSEKNISRMLRQYAHTGFAYANYEGASDYGISVTSPAFIMALIAPLEDIRMVNYSEKSWDNHHDIIALQRRDISE